MLPLSYSSRLRHRCWVRSRKSDRWLESSDGGAVSMTEEGWRHGGGAEQHGGGKHRHEAELGALEEHGGGGVGLEEFLGGL